MVEAKIGEHPFISMGQRVVVGAGTLICHAGTPFVRARVLAVGVIVCAAAGSSSAAPLAAQGTWQGTCAAGARRARNGRAGDTATRGADGSVAPRAAQRRSSPGDPEPVVDVGVLSGRQIAWVNVVTLPPEPLPGAAAVLDGLHVRTRPRIIRRELLFAAGDTVDSLRVSESLRRLRRLRYLAEVQLASSPADTAACSGPGAASGSVTQPIGLTVTTRDAWSTRPNLRVGSGTAGSVMGLEERNLMGTGRVAKAYLRTDNGRLGAGVAYIDPWLFGRDMVGSVSRDVFRDGAAWQGAVGTHERSVFDPWIVELAVAQSARAAYGPVYGVAQGGVNDTVRRGTAHLLFSRLARASPFGATRFLFGVEGERTREVVSSTAPVVGPLDVHRSFAGVDVGLAHHTARYESNTWLLPQPRSGARSLVDIPNGAEGEIVAAVGQDFVGGRRAIHLDAWGGRMWSPGQHSLITADAWASGFRTGPEWSAASIRGKIGAYREGVRGLWSMHLAAEDLTDPDPTVRTLSSFDPTIPSLPPRSRLAEAAVAGSLERTLHVRPITHSYMLDVAAFGAGSLRWDPAATLKDQFGIAAVGAGLRLSPLRQGIATLRLDVGFPVMHSAGLPSRPFVALSISPWLGAGRQRDGLGGH